MKNQSSQPSFSFTDAHLPVYCLETQLLYLCMQMPPFKHLIAVSHLQETCFLFLVGFLVVCFLLLVSLQYRNARFSITF